MSKTTLIVAGIIVIVTGIVAFDSMFTVHQTQQALVLQFGRPVKVESSPGLKFKLPFLQDVEYFDRRILDLDPPAEEVLLADQKRINVDSFVRYKIVDPLKFKQRAVTTRNFLQIFGGQGAVRGRPDPARRHAVGKAGGSDAAGCRSAQGAGAQFRYRGGGRAHRPHRPAGSHQPGGV